MQRVLVILCILTGCYEDPDYGTTSFRCDATHECPPGQTCVNGRCTGGGAGVDAANKDGPPNTLGVACGTATCTTGQKCCVDFVTAPRCIPLADNCSGYEATCDGTEDCNGSPCCDTSNNIACGTTCSNQICLQPSDCSTPGSMDCCFGFTPGEPWGRCFPNCP